MLWYLKFHFKSMWRKTVVYNYVVKNINIKQALFFSYLKKPGLKTKKNRAKRYETVNILGF